MALKGHFQCRCSNINDLVDIKSFFHQSVSILGRLSNLLRLLEVTIASDAFEDHYWTEYEKLMARIVDSSQISQNLEASV